jgi:hypothetical protein
VAQAQESGPLPTLYKWWERLPLNSISILPFKCVVSLRTEFRVPVPTAPVWTFSVLNNYSMSRFFINYRYRYTGTSFCAWVLGVLNLNHK